MVLYSSILTIVSFGPIETNEFFVKIFKFRLLEDVEGDLDRMLQDDQSEEEEEEDENEADMFGDEPFNAKFESIGFESQLWIQNMSTNFPILATYVVTIIITYLMKPMFKNVESAKEGETPKWFSCAWIKDGVHLLNKTCKQYLVVSMMEMFIEVSVSTWINVYSLINHQHSIEFSNLGAGDWLNLACMAFFGILNLLLPVYILKQDSSQIS
jgi:hypothetical protein